MINQLNAKDIKEQVSIVLLLAQLGHHPVPGHRNEKYYFSMLREAERTPSFCVNENLGVWYDHGIGKGGNIIDFAVAYWNKLSFQEVLVKIVDTCNQVIQPRNEGHRQRLPKPAVKLPFYKVAEIKELGNNPAITQYIKERGVWTQAVGRLKEVYYYCNDDKNKPKYFFAAGWQNEKRCWEVRNKYFKGCVGNKAVTIVPGNTSQLMIFEGYFNYLSWLADNPNCQSSVLILNSQSFLEVAIQMAKGYKEVWLFFDRDKTGEASTLLFRQAVPHATDHSLIYSSFNDYNDMLLSTLNPYDKPDIFRHAFER